MMTKRAKNIIAISIIPQVLLVKWLGNYPEAVEKYYSNGIYPVISKISRSLFGWLPFSIGDILIATALFFILRYLITKRKSIIKHPILFIRNIFLVLSTTYFLFNILWGLNYYRTPIKEKLGSTGNWTYTNEELLYFTKNIIKKTNTVHYSIVNDSTKAVVVPYDYKTLLKMTKDGYENLKENPFIKSHTPESIKKSLFSTPLSYMGTSGHLNPFTNEAQLNYNIPKYYFPYVAAHEMAHQIGYAAESEASFIGFLTAINHKDKYFQYAALTSVLNSSLIRIKERDETSFQKIKTTINSGVFKNYQESRDNNKKYENPLEPYIKLFYSSFLKANNQKKGIKSYGGVVDLLIYYEISSDSTNLSSNK